MYIITYMYLHGYFTYLTLRGLMSLQMFVIGVRDKPLKMDEKVDGFSAALWPK